MKPSMAVYATVLYHRHFLKQLYSMGMCIPVYHMTPHKYGCVLYTVQCSALDNEGWPLQIKTQGGMHMDASWLICPLSTSRL
jgi:hypothetical protein